MSSAPLFRVVYTVGFVGMVCFGAYLRTNSTVALGASVACVIVCGIIAVYRCGPLAAVLSRRPSVAYVYAVCRFRERTLVSKFSGCIPRAVLHDGECVATAFHRITLHGFRPSELVETSKGQRIRREPTEPQIKLTLRQGLVGQCFIIDLTVQEVARITLCHRGMVLVRDSSVELTQSSLLEESREIIRQVQAECRVASRERPAFTEGKYVGMWAEANAT